jgi:hypothetical protein
LLLKTQCEVCVFAILTVHLLLWLSSWLPHFKNCCSFNCLLITHDLLFYSFWLIQSDCRLEECMMDLIVNLRFQLPFGSCNASSSKFRQIMKKKFRNEYISLCRKLWICWWPMLTFRYKKWKLLFAKVVLCFNQ